VAQTGKDRNPYMVKNFYGKGSPVCKQEACHAARIFLSRQNVSGAV
jgi:hypothetical protein